MALHLIGEEPDGVRRARRLATCARGSQDVVFCYLRFPSGVVAHLHLSWLDPHKERRITVVGAQRMATFDDMLIEGKLTVYDKGFDEDTRSWGEYIARSGDIFSPRISNRRAAAAGVRALHRVRPHRRRRRARTGTSGLRVVRVLERAAALARRSLRLSARPLSE